MYGSLSRIKMLQLFLSLICLFGAFASIQAWSCVGLQTMLRRPGAPLRSGSGKAALLTQLQAKKDTKPPPPDFLFQQFKTAKGEVLDPYKALRVKQTASVEEIKQAYRQLSRKYHADANRFRDVLPGSCNNKEEVRDEWERIKMAYEILRDPKLRLRYDRNVVIADPGAAIQRAALDAMGKSVQGVGQAVGKGLFGMGKGLLDVGAFTLEKITSVHEETKNKPAKSKNSDDNNQNDNSDQQNVVSQTSVDESMVQSNQSAVSSPEQAQVQPVTLDA